MNKQITERKSLEARALFVMATDHAKKSREYEIALSALLGYPENDDQVYMGHLSDAIVNGRFEFDDSLRKEGFTVRKPKLKK